MKSIRAALVLIFACTGGLLAFGAPAGSQGSEPYISPFGDLTIEADELIPGATVMLSGGGFTPDTPVFLTVRQNATAGVLVEDEGRSDDAGAAAFELVLDERFEPGGYSAVVRGTTIDGAILDLSGGFNIDAPEEPTPTPTPGEGPVLPTPRPTTEPTPRPAPTPTPTPRAPILGPTPTPEGAVPTPSPTPLPALPGDGDGDAEVLGESIDGDDPDGAAGSDGDGTPETSTETSATDVAGDGDGAAGEQAAAVDGDDEVAAPALEGSGGIGGLEIAGLLAAIALIGGGAFVMYRRSARTTPTHAE